jgi:hypothetical protein
VIDFLLDTAIDSEIEAKILVEAALGHGGAFKMEVCDSTEVRKTNSLGKDSDDDGEAEWKRLPGKKSVFDESDDDDADEQGGHEERGRQARVEVGKARAMLEAKGAPRQQLSEESAATCIGRIYRARRGRNAARRVLVETWRKRYDRESGCHYYENVIWGTSIWEAPVLFHRLFPGRIW